jgi:hypothetical protein
MFDLHAEEHIVGQALLSIQQEAFQQQPDMLVVMHIASENVPKRIYILPSQAWTSLEAMPNHFFITKDCVECEIEPVLSVVVSMVFVVMNVCRTENVITYFDGCFCQKRTTCPLTVEDPVGTIPRVYFVLLQAVLQQGILGLSRV